MASISKAAACGVAVLMSGYAMAQCYDIKKSLSVITYPCQAMAACDACDANVWYLWPGTQCQKVRSVPPTYQRTCVTGWVQQGEGVCTCFPNDPSEQWTLTTAEIECVDPC